MLLPGAVLSIWLWLVQAMYDRTCVGHPIQCMNILVQVQTVPVNPSVSSEGRRVSLLSCGCSFCKGQGLTDPFSFKQFDAVVKSGEDVDTAPIPAFAAKTVDCWVTMSLQSTFI